jgi:hypothetical protein
MLRRLTVLLLLILSTLVPGVAGALGIEKGVKFGVNLANLRGDFADVANPDGKLGLVGGPFVVFVLVPEFAVQIEALYSMKGAKLTSTSTDEAGNVLGTIHTFESLNYLEVPLLLRGTPLPGARVQPLIVAGPTLGFGLGANLSSDEPGLPSVHLDHLKAVDVGFAVGVGARFHAGGKKRVITEVRYTSGFSDVWDIAGNLESINSVFSFTAGLAF